MNEIESLILRLQERTLKEDKRQCESVAFAEGWLQTLKQINPNDKFTVKDIFNLLATLNQIKK